MASAHRNPNTSPRPYRFSEERAPHFGVERGAPFAEAAKGAATASLNRSLPLPEDALAIIEAAGGEAWCVGGFVRDALLGRPIHDVDIATSLPWPEVQAAFQHAGWSTVETGIAHGTLTVVRPWRSPPTAPKAPTATDAIPIP